MAEVEVASMAGAKQKTVAPAVAKTALSTYIEGIQSAFKSKEAVYLLTDETATDVDVIPTGIPALDLALGCGGIPRGRIVEIYGPESSGKTTLCLQIAAQAQKDNLLVHFIDAEHALDPVYASELGVDLSSLPISQPNNGEEALSVAEHGVQNGAGLVIIDSVAALVPQSELDGEMGDQQMGIQARLMSQAMRKLTSIASKNNCTIIFINQIRHKIGGYGNPETTPGGNALKFYASVRIDIRKGQVNKPGEDADPIGQETKIKIVKNKCAAPFKTCEFDLIYGKGFDTLKSLLAVAIERGIVKQAGAWISYKDQKWQGMNAAKEALAAAQDTLKEIAEAL